MSGTASMHPVNSDVSAYARIYNWAHVFRVSPTSHPHLAPDFTALDPGLTFDTYLLPGRQSL